jgi:hypothetical protein
LEALWWVTQWAEESRLKALPPFARANTGLCMVGPQAQPFPSLGWGRSLLHPYPRPFHPDSQISVHTSCCLMTHWGWGGEKISELPFTFIF